MDLVCETKYPCTYTDAFRLSEPKSQSSYKSVYASTPGPLETLPKVSQVSTDPTWTGTDTIIGKIGFNFFQ